MQFFFAGAIELVFFAVVDDGIFSYFVLFEIDFESFCGGGVHCRFDDFDDIFGIFRRQGLVEYVAVFLQFVLDFGENCGYNSFCLQDRLLSW